MFKFFRKIKQQLLKEGNLKTYVLYAIGEIILVMIGILLALQVNNWNEQKKNIQEEMIILKDLHNEFVQNKEDLKNHIEGKEKLKSKWNVLFQTINNPQLPIEQRIIERTELGSIPFFSTNSTLNSLLFSGKIDKITNDTLKKTLTSWNDITSLFSEPEKLHLNFAIEMFLPYERSILPEGIGVEHYDKGFQSPFITKQERQQMLLKAYDDLEYQNNLIRNNYWQKVIITAGHQLIKEHEKTIKILEAEIAKN